MLEKVKLKYQVLSVLRRKFNTKTKRSEYALLSRDGEKVLRWFGPSRPSEERVKKEERRVQFFKHHG